MILSLVAAPVGAASLEGVVEVRFNVVKSSFESTEYSTFKYPVANGIQSDSMSSVSSGSSVLISPNRFRFDMNDQILSGSVGVYVSFYLYADAPSSIMSPDPDSVRYWNFRHDDVDGNSTYYDQLTPILFNVPDQNELYSYSSGYLLKGRFNIIDDYYPTRNITLINSSATEAFTYSVSSSSSSSQTVYFCVPSISLVIGNSSSELDSLEDIADSLAAQSEVMSQYYGDVMSLLNDLYNRLGDMQSVQELTNTYFATLIPLVESIDGNTAQIHSLLQTQFQFLRTLIATESDDIQAAIAQQTEDLKAYFDTVFAGAVGDMPEKSDDLETSVGDFSSAEQDYQSNASARFDELAASFNGFSGGTLSGITLASTLFTRVWDALGEYSIVYLYPLLLGLCLLLIGRLSRLSGGQSSSEKHRGDSDA